MCVLCFVNEAAVLVAGACVHLFMADCRCDQDHGCKADGWSLSSGDVFPAHAGGSSKGAVSPEYGLCVPKA